MAASGKVLILPHDRMPDYRAQAEIGDAADHLAMLRDGLMHVYAGLPEGPTEMLEGRAP